MRISGASVTAVMERHTDHRALLTTSCSTVGCNAPAPLIIDDKRWCVGCVHLQAPNEW